MTSRIVEAWKADPGKTQAHEPTPDEVAFQAFRIGLGVIQDMTAPKEAATPAMARSLGKTRRRR